MAFVVDAQYISAGPGGGPTALTLELTLSGVAAGDAIVLFGQCNNGISSGTMSFADSHANTYATPLQVSVGQSVYQAGTYALDVAAGAPTVTMTVQTTDWRGFYALVLREVPTTSAVEDSDIGVGVGSTATTPAISAITDGLIVACLQHFGTTNSAAPGWTEILDDETFVNVAGSLIMRLTTAGNSYAPTWTLSDADAWSAIGFQFKGIAVVPPTATFRSLKAGGFGVHCG